LTGFTVPVTSPTTDGAEYFSSVRL